MEHVTAAKPVLRKNFPISDMKKKKIELDPFPWEEKTKLKRCFHKDCSMEAKFPAPKSPKKIREIIWLCKEHIKEHNRSWNFFSKMSQEEIEQCIKLDVIGRRPSWPLGSQKSKFFKNTEKIFDAFDWYNEENGKENKNRFSKHQVTSKKREAMNLLGLKEDFTYKKLKEKYKKLVKIYHPDLNKGSKKYEEKLKMINQAYVVLKTDIIV